MLFKRLSSNGVPSTGNVVELSFSTPSPFQGDNPAGKPGCMAEPPKGNRQGESVMTDGMGVECLIRRLTNGIQLKL